jgi:hypothetical protein
MAVFVVAAYYIPYAVVLLGTEVGREQWSSKRKLSAIAVQQHDVDASISSDREV